MAFTQAQEDRFHYELDLNMGGRVINRVAEAELNGDYVLVVGLGGLGCTAVSAVKTSVWLNCGEKNQDKLRFLAFDTDKYFLEALARPDRDSVGLEPGTEAVFMDAANDMNPIVLPDDYEMVSRTAAGKWLHRRTKANLRGHGAGRVRQAGRLLFSYVTAGRILEAKLVHALSAMGREARKVTVFLLSSTGGGTGSGSFLDTAYLIRKLAENNGIIVELNGYLFMADVREDKKDLTQMQANSYAAMKELDHFMNLSRHGFGEAKEQYEFSYQDGLQEIKFTTNVFDVCTLICGTPGDGSAALFKNPTAKAMHTAADSIFASLVASREDQNAENEKIPLLSSIMDNHSTDVADNVKNKLKDFPKEALYEYRTVGYGTVRMPVEECLVYVAGKIFGKMWDLWHENQPVNTDVEDLCTACEVSRNFLPGIPESIGNFKNYTKDNLKGKNPDTAMASTVENYRKNTLTPAVDKQVEKVLKALDRELDKICRDPEKGPYYLIALVAGEMKTGTPLLDKLQKELSDKGDERAGLLGAQDKKDNQDKQDEPERKKALKKFNESVEILGFLGNKSSAFKDCKNEYVKYYTNEAKIARFDAWMAYYEKVIAGLNERNNEIWDVFTTVITELKAVLDKNFGIVTGTETRSDAAKTTFSWSLVDLGATEDPKAKKLKEWLDGLTVGKNTADYMKAFVKKLLDSKDSWLDLLQKAEAGRLAEEIRAFLETEFADLIRLNLDDFINIAYGGGLQNARQAAGEIWQRLKNASAPVFDTTSGMGLNNYLCYSYVLVPANAPMLKQNLQLMGDPGVEIYDCDATDEVVRVRVYDGIPLFAVRQLAEGEMLYNDAPAQNRYGMHLNEAWRDFPQLLNAETWARHPGFNPEYRNGDGSTARGREDAAQTDAEALVKDALKYGVLYWNQTSDGAPSCYRLHAPDYGDLPLTEDGRLSEVGRKAVKAALDAMALDQVLSFGGDGQPDGGLSPAACGVFAETVSKHSGGSTVSETDRELPAVYDTSEVAKKQGDVTALARDLRGDPFRMGKLRELIDVLKPIAEEYLAAWRERT